MFINYVEKNEMKLNQSTFGGKCPIIEFSIEDVRKMKKKEKQVEENKLKQKEMKKVIIPKEEK